jgi:hypothetical protein
MSRRTVLSLSLICGATLAVFACSADRMTSPSATVPTATVGATDGRVSALDAEDKVTICHVPPGNPENAHTITIGASAVPAHLENHEGDRVGACPEPSPSPSPTPPPG